jgi:hypothetical protein
MMQNAKADKITLALLCKVPSQNHHAMQVKKDNPANNTMQLKKSC